MGVIKIQRAWFILFFLVQQPLLSAQDDWVESVANSVIYDTGLAWNKAGGDWTDANGIAYGTDAPYAVVTIERSGDEQLVEADVTGLVNEWISGTHANKGMLLRYLDGTVCRCARFFSREQSSTKSAKLIVTRNDNTIMEYPVAADTEINTNPQATQALGGRMYYRIEHRVNALIRFTLEESQTVKQALLVLTTYPTTYKDQLIFGVFRSSQGEPLSNPGTSRPNPPGQFSLKVVARSAPGGTDPGGTDPGGTDPGGTDPGGTDPGGTDPGGTDPGGTDPGGTDPGGTDPGGTDPGGTNPGGTNPGGSAAGTFTVSWEAPTTYDNGDPLDPSQDITHYRVYYGTQSRSYDVGPIEVSPSTTSLVVDSLPTHTYFVVVTSVDRSGIESDFSQEARVDVVAP